MKNKIYGNVLVSCKIHWSYYLLPLFLSALFVVGAVSYTIGGNGSDGLILLIGAAFFGLLPALRIATSKFILTDKMLYSKVGFIRTKEMSSPVDKIQNIRLSSSLAGKLFGCSNVNIDTVSGVYVMRNVKGAEALVVAFYGLK